MHNVTILMKYEWKKLLQKKLVVISIVLIFFLQIFSNLMFLQEVDSRSYIDAEGQVIKQTITGYENMIQSKKNARLLEGRVIDGHLLEEIEKELDGNALSSVFNEATRVFRMMTQQSISRLYGLNTEEVYALWHTNTRHGYQDYQLSAGEIAYWEERVNSIETPFVYRYDLAWAGIFEQVLTNGVLLLLLIAICLAGIFTDEHKLRTDQMLLCTRNSKQVYHAKMLTGSIFGISCALLLYGITFGFCFALYGTDGFYNILQLRMATSPYPITLGQAAFIIVGLTILAAVLESTFTMLLSEVFNNSLGVMALLVGIMLLTQFIIIPERYRMLSQAWSFLPTNLVTCWGFGDGRLVPILGGYLNNFQFAGILYPVLTVLFLCLAYRAYTRFQVTGR